MDKYRISQSEIDSNNVKSAPTHNISEEPRANKHIFDKLPELIAEKHNMFVDNFKAIVKDLFTEHDKEIGAGDMLKAVYDTDGDGVVDNAEKLDGQPAGYYATAESGVQIYTQSEDVLTGTGANGKFKAETTGTYTAFTIGGVSYAVKAGSETEIELTSGVWYSFILDTEAKTINFKTGGAGLNFKIVGGTTQPASPKENTIWINTDTAIGEWQFSATEPTTRADGTALQTGDIWIRTSNVTPIKFNALKKNSIQLYPYGANQYNGTEMEAVDIEIFQNGKWENASGFILAGGDIFEDITGGFTAYNPTSSTYSLASYTINENGINITLSGSKKAIAVRTVNKIDLTDVKAVEVKVSGNFNSVSLSVTNGNASNIHQSGATNSIASVGIAEEGVHTLDVSSINGSYNIGVNERTYDSYNGTFTVEYIRLIY